MFTLDSTYGPQVTSSDLKLSDKMAEALASNGPVMYLLLNGFKQSIGDAAAGEKDEAKAVDKRLKKLSAILDGTVAVGTRGPQKRGLDAFKAEAALVVLKAIFKKGGKSWPTGKGSAAEVNGMVADFWAKANPNANLQAARASAERAAKEAFDMQSAAADGADDLGL